MDMYKAFDVSFNVFKHTLATAAGIDAIRHAYLGATTGDPGNYFVAAIEASFTTFMEVAMYLERKREKKIESHLQSIEEARRGLDEATGRLEREVQNLPEKPKNFH